MEVFQSSIQNSRANDIPWGPVRSLLLDEYSFRGIKEIVGYAGIDMVQLAHLEQKSPQGATKSQLLSAVEMQIERMDASQARKVASICCEEMLQRRPDFADKIERVLSRVGWKFLNNTLLPIDVLDIAELREIPKQAHEDLQKAARRLRDGDLSGAVSSAASALYSVTGSILQEFERGDYQEMSFQQKIKESLKIIKFSDTFKKELKDIGWLEPDIQMFLQNLEGSLNQAAFVMQKLRSTMGDVHGTKPVVSALVYDSIKWSLIILRILGTRNDL